MLRYLNERRIQLRNKLLEYRMGEYLLSPMIRARAAWKLKKIAPSESQLNEITAEWRGRIDDVLSSPDNAAIPRVPDAGVLKDNVITMHNGIRVYALSYYGAGNLRMLIENKGVHEPQEERAFLEVLPHLPAKSTMLELGSYWAFYSLWFQSAVKDAVCYMVEPDSANIAAGQNNFELNGCKGHFEQAYVGEVDKTPLAEPQTISVDGFCARHDIKHLNVLHSDIQCFEADMLRGAKGMLSRGAVDYVFISTHSNELHRECVEILSGHNYLILASADMDQSYSFDGLIVAKRGTLESGPVKLEISHKTTARVA